MSCCRPRFLCLLLALSGALCICKVVLYATPRCALALRMLTCSTACQNAASDGQRVCVTMAAAAALSFQTL